MQIWIKPPYQTEYQTTIQEFNELAISGKINSNECYYWAEGMIDWEPASRIINFNKNVVPPPIPPPLINTNYLSGGTNLSNSNPNVVDSSNNGLVFDNEIAASFIGKKFEYYRNKWEIANLKKRSSFTRGKSFNWAAFFFAIPWLAYRKMYAKASVILFIYFLINLIDYVISTNVKFYSHSLVNTLATAIGGTVGWYGNSWYKSHMIKMINLISIQNPNKISQLETARRLGGTNLWACILFIILVIFSSCIFALLQGDASS